MFLFSLLLTLGACASDDSCEGGMCDVDEADEPRRDETSAPIDAPSPLHCRAACDVLMDSCEPREPDDSTRDDGSAECVDWCAGGGLTRDEASCLASVGCGGESAACFD